MTRIALLLLLFVSALQVGAQPTIHFSENGLTAAFEKSKIENKLVFFMGFASWCPHCKKMKEQVFTDSVVADYYNTHFICIAQDMEKGAGVQLHQKFAIKSYPTFIFMDSTGTVLYRITGEFKAPEFIEDGKYAQMPDKQLPYLNRQFEGAVNNPDKCLNYLRALKKADLDYAAVVGQYFATQTDNDLLSEINWQIIANGVTAINSREFQFVLSHQKEFAALASPERVERKIFFLVKELLYPLAELKDTINYFKSREAAVAIHQYRIDSLIFRDDLVFYENTSNWNAYKKEALEFAETYIWTDYNALNEVSGNFLNKITDPAALAKSVTWADRSLALSESYGTYLLDAKLRRKVNDIPAAVNMAKLAKNLAEKYGWDQQEADSLLKVLH